MKQWTLITGASSGIGLATAELLAKQKTPLWLVARRRDRLQDLKKRLGKSTEIKISTLDVSKRSAVERFALAEKAELKRVSVLVNNAGLALGAKSLQEGNIEDWQTMLDTNVMGLLHLTKLALKGMVERKSGHIMNIGSVAGRWAYLGGNVYCASKSAVHMISETLRIDLLGLGIRVSEINPGMVETEFSQVRFNDAQKAKLVYQGMTPLTAEDVAEAIVWCLNRPPHVNIQELVLYPTDQASPAHVHRLKSSP